ncbi:uncharacterized protein LOC127874148 [Dreissena polymorpha]|uniref:uncharacterized protein LOC127874148 n=1 Tax=Dreissena polymorpha TaxID=45954 RepID=UPI002263EBE7|nr:uncharacterized protein LOC127874148 [Dreissena polymorpha]
MDWMNLVWTYSLLCVVPVVLGVDGDTCRDIDTQACVLMAQRNPALCQDQVLRQTACPKFCNICPLECYHCDVSVRDYVNCNMTTICDLNQQCMLQKMHSSQDGHDEYVMGCASLQLCDGGGLTLTFGRRELQERNVEVTCCNTDRCNLPTESSTVPTTTKHIPSCVRDIVLIVEDYNEKNDHTHTGGYSTPYLVAFLKELVSSLTIGLSESLVELSLADSDVHSIWSLADHTTNDSLLTAINGIPFRHQKDNLDISGIVNYVSRDAFSIRSGDRPSVPNTVVIFVDHRARPSTSRTGQVNGVDYGAQHNVHLASGNVIIINIGPPDHSDVTKISVLATDASHVLTVADYAALSGIKETLVNLICN